MDTEKIEQDFGKIHLLIDNLLQTRERTNSNSNSFQLMLSLVLSSTVQMKNSLIKYLDFETNNTQE